MILEAIHATAKLVFFLNMALMFVMEMKKVWTALMPPTQGWVWIILSS